MDLLSKPLLLAALFTTGCASSGTSPTPNKTAASDVLPASVNTSTLQVTDMAGESHDLGAVAAETPVVLVFWQTWCASCREEAPSLIRASQEHDGELAFFGVVPGPDEVVDDEEVKRVAEQQNNPWPQVRDRDLLLTNLFEVEGTPTIIVLGGGGEVLYSEHHAPDDWGRFVR